MKKLAFVFSFMLLGVFAFANYGNLDSMELNKEATTEYMTFEDRCFVRYCVETPNGLSCTEWKEIPCGIQ